MVDRKHKGSRLKHREHYKTRSRNRVTLAMSSKPWLLEVNRAGR